MSDEAKLQLSGDLVREVQQVLENADANASHPVVAVQYLAAITGYLVAQMDEPVSVRKEYLEQLAQFAHSVFIDMESRKQARPAANAGPAMGVWRPGDA